MGSQAVFRCDYRDSGGVLIAERAYAYAYDAVGNRVSATETTNNWAYTANALNQYTSIIGNNDGTFIPEYDEDGHQTSAKPETRPTGDRDFIAVQQGRSGERHPATRRKLHQHQTLVKTETCVWRVADYRIGWSSEYFDRELRCHYYNYRHLIQGVARWSALAPEDEETGYRFLENNAQNNVDELGLKQVGPPIVCGGCLICIDNDSPSGDGNGYKIHWNCRKRKRATTCRGGGTAHWPSGRGSHGAGGEIPPKIKKCLGTRWEIHPEKVKEERTPCCEENEYRVLKPAVAGAGGCVLGYVIYKTIKVCGGGTAGFFIAGPAGAAAGISICVATP